MMSGGVFESMEFIIDIMSGVVVVLCILAFVFGVVLTIKAIKKKNKEAFKPLLAGFVTLAAGVLSLLYGWMIRNPEWGLTQSSSSSNSSIFYFGILILIVAMYKYASKSSKQNQWNSEVDNEENDGESDKVVD